MASILSREELEADIAIVKSLLNSQLKNILRSEHMMVSGVKSMLQNRIISYMQRRHEEGDVARLARIRNTIREVRGAGNASASAPAPAATGGIVAANTATPSQSPPYQNGHGQFVHHHHPSSWSSNAPATSTFQHGRLSFKDSPFHTILEPLTTVGECKIRETTRDTVELKLTLTPTVTARLTTDPNIRILVYCAADNGLTSFTKSDVAFPAQVELKVNFDAVPAKLRGLKNKPGTTNPADITRYVRKKANYPNKIDLVYALTTKRYFVVVNLVQRHPVDELVKRLQSRVITTEQVLQEMRNKADDPDIETTSTVMSLHCPISASRIRTPCRSAICTHNRCFDAESFLLLQEQAPTWTCPVCNKVTTYESLQVDLYVDNILKSTDEGTEQVTIEPDGGWSVYGEGNVIEGGGGVAPPAATAQAAPATPGGSDVEVLEIDDDDNRSGVGAAGGVGGGVKKEVSETSTPLGVSSQIPTLSQHTPSRSGTKRAFSEVIDLTLDSDEEEQEDHQGQQGGNGGDQQQTNAPSSPPTASPSYSPSSDDDEPIRPAKRIHIEHRHHPPPPPSHNNQHQQQHHPQRPQQYTTTQQQPHYTPRSPRTTTSSTTPAEISFPFPTFKPAILPNPSFDIMAPGYRGGGGGGGTNARVGSGSNISGASGTGATTRSGSGGNSIPLPTQSIPLPTQPQQQQQQRQQGQGQGQQSSSSSSPVGGMGWYDVHDTVDYT